MAELLWSVPIVHLTPEHFADTSPARTNSGRIKIAVYYLQSWVQDARFSCCCDRRLDTNEIQHRPKCGRCSRLWTRMRGYPLSIHTNCDWWQFGQSEFKSVKMKEVVSWAEVAFYASQWRSPETMWSDQNWMRPTPLLVQSTGTENRLDDRVGRRNLQKDHNGRYSHT